MNVVYDYENEVLNIDDGLKTRNYIIVFCALINMSLAYLKLKHTDFYHLSFNEFTWVAIGSFTLLYLTLFLIRYSFAEKIPIEDIIGLQQTEDYNGVSYFIILKNGKKRKLYKMKTAEEFSQLESLIAKIEG